MLFPDLGPQYLGQEYPDALKRMQTSYYEAITLNQAYWSEADLNNRFVAGDQTLFSDFYGNLPINRRRQYNFNRLRRIKNMITGHQRRTRKSIICTPIENGDAETADQYTKILMWLNQKEQILETISDAFEGAVVSGMTLLHAYMDYREDPVSGNIKLDKCAYNSFLIDPYFRKADLSDCNFVWKRTYMTKREVLSLMPDKEDLIMTLHGQDNGSDRDGKFQFMPENYSWSMSRLLTYDEYYYRDYRKQKMLVDRNTGESMEWKHNDDDALKLFLQTYPGVTVIEQDIPTCKLTINVQGQILYDGPNPTGSDKYPFVPIWCYYNPDLAYFPYRIQGVINDLRDSQYLYNRRKIIELDILESQINSGWKYKENALVNPADVFLQGQGKGLALKSEAQMTDVEQILPPQVPPSMIELSKLLAEEMNQVSGINEELLGSANDDKAGVLAMLRQGAGLTTLQPLFDQLDRSQKLLGELLLDMIQANFTPGKVKKILEGQEPTAQFHQKAFGRYGCTIEDGANTTTQKQMQFLQLLQLREIGVPIPDISLLNAAVISGKKELEGAMKQQQEQQSQQMQQQNQIAQQEIQARMESLKAKAAADQGLAVERSSRVEENKALALERESKAHLDEQTGMLNIIKALKEIDQIDINQVEKLIKLSQIVKEQEALEQQAMFGNNNYQQPPEQFTEQPTPYDQMGQMNQQLAPAQTEQAPISENAQF